MYSYEDRIRAVGLNIKLGKRVRPSIQQLGYPTMNTLKGWYKKYEQRLDLPVAYGVRAGQVTRAALVERRGVQLGRTDPRLICGGSVHRRASHSQLSKASICDTDCPCRNAPYICRLAPNIDYDREQHAETIYSYLIDFQSRSGNTLCRHQPRPSMLMATAWSCKNCVNSMLATCLIGVENLRRAVPINGFL